MEPLDDRIARRRAEIAEQQAALDRQDAHDDTADDARPAVVDRGHRGGAVRSALFLILLVVAGGLFGLAVTLTRFAGGDFAQAHRQGTAQVSSCVRHGPITNKGFGYWDRCTATITWDDATTDRISINAVFTTSDIGTTVRVGDLGIYRTTTELVRADTPRRAWLAWIGYALGAIAFIPALIATLSVRALLRYRRR